VLPSAISSQPFDKLRAGNPKSNLQWAIVNCQSSISSPTLTAAYHLCARKRVIFRPVFIEGADGNSFPACGLSDMARFFNFPAQHAVAHARLRAQIGQLPWTATVPQMEQLPLETSVCIHIYSSLVLSIGAAEILLRREQVVF